MKSRTGRSQTSRPTAEERFWKRVNAGKDNECWNWTGGITNNGYGFLQVGNKSKLSNRLTWLFTRGEIPPGYCVCHKCDNKLCCNPNHLFLGTLADNNRDRHAKGRDVAWTGDTHPSSKISSSDVRAIREMYATGKYKLIEIAPMFGIKKSQVSNIVRRLNWKSVD